MHRPLKLPLKVLFRPSKQQFADHCLKTNLALHYAKLIVSHQLNNAYNGTRENKYTGLGLVTFGLVSGFFTFE